MRVKNHLAIVALLVGGFSFPSPLFAQQPAPASGTRIAVVDPGFIVENHPTIRQKQAAIREQVKAAQEELVKRREALVKEAEQLKDFKEGSPQFNQLQERLANQEAQLKLDMVRKEKELDGVEATMAISFYQELQLMIKSVAEHNQIDLVLRSNRKEPDLKQPATIQMALEKGVVYSKPTLDMTDMILQLIKQQAPEAPAASSTTGAPMRSATAPGIANPVR